MRIATETGDGGLTGGTGLPTRGRSAKARWRAAAELACVRWLLRVERLLALASWRQQDYRRAAAWVSLRLPAGAVVTPVSEREQQTGASGGGRRGGPKPG
jgi:hypothetical protein